jgi:hypothetical protein
MEVEEQQQPQNQSESIVLADEIEVIPMKVEEEQQQQPEVVFFDDTLNNNDPIYPTPGINKLYEELKIVSDSDDKTLSILFDQKYRVPTEFDNFAQIQYIVDFVKFNIDAMKSSSTLKAVLLALKTDCEKNGIPLDLAIPFSQVLITRKLTNKPVFIAHTKGKGAYNIYDMDEHPSKYKKKTTKECGHCKKVEKLQLCSRCKTAAYCCRDCQKLDYDFHKTYCRMYTNTNKK